MRGNAPCGVKGVMGYALSARGIFAQAQKCRMYQSRSTFPQGVALGYGQHLGLQPAPIIYRTFVQIGSFSTDVFLIFSAALGIARTSSALHSLARKFALRFSAALGIARTSVRLCTRLHENWRRLGIARSNKFVGLCACLAQTFLFSSLTNIDYRRGVELKTFCILAALFLILQCCLLIELIYALR